MLKCEKCNVDLSKGNIVMLSSPTNTHAAWFKCKKCNWTDYYAVPKYIGVKQFKRYLNAKV